MKREEFIEKLLSDTPFYEDNEYYCLGNTLEEAGRIVRTIVERSNEDVGVATKRNK